MSEERGRTDVVLIPGRVVRVLLLVMAVLFVARVSTAWWHARVGEMDRFGIMRQFNTNYEANAPTYFSVLLLLFAAALLSLIASAKRQEHDRYARHWAALSVIFVCMSVDEACQVHEYCGEFVCFLKGRLGLLDGFAWVIVGALIALTVVAVLFRFWWNLPRQWKVAFAAAGFVYLVFGALGGEVLSALTPIAGVHQRLAYAAVETFEEFSEMAGLVIMIWGLMTYMEAHGIMVRLQVRQDARVPVAERHRSQAAEGRDRVGIASGG
jgi:hypothetical protein